MNTTMNKTHIQALGLGLAVLIADQITKMLVLAHVSGKTIAVLPFFNLVHVWNRGVSFGLFGGGESALMPWILTACALFIVIFLLIWLFRTAHAPLALAIGAVIGGALGNIIDRARFGAVVDFLDFHAFDWHYPAFNIADSAIVLGIAFVLLDSLFWEPKRNKTEKTAKE